MSKFGMLLVDAQTFAAQFQDVQPFMAGFRDQLHAQEEVRVFVDAAPGMGHQAASVHVLLRLIFGFGYGLAPGQRVLVVYRTTYAGGVDRPTESKLARLLPGFEVPADGQIPHGIYVGPDQTPTPPPNVFFLPYENEAGRDALGQVEFGFGGGVDPFPGGQGSMPQLAELLHVRYFLALQPYQFQNPNYIAYQAPGGAFEWENLQFRFPWLNDYIFYQPGLPEGQVPWATFEQQGDVEIRKRARTLHRILRVLNPNLVLSPTYSIDENRVTGVRPEVLALTYVSAMLKTGVSTIVVNFGRMSRPSAARLTELVHGGMTREERDARQVLDNQGEPEDPPPAHLVEMHQAVDAYRARADELARTDAQRRTRVLHAANIPDDLDALNEAIDWCNAQQGDSRVLFVQLGAVSPVIFRAALDRAGQPAVFEGPNTAITAMNAGAPYLHMTRLQGAPQGWAYPRVIAGVDWTPQVEQSIVSASYLLHGFDRNWVADGWPPNLQIFADATDDIWDFAADAFADAGSHLRDYFVSIRDNLATEINDRLVRGIGIMVNQFTQAPPPALGVEVPKLTALQERLLAAIQDGEIALLRDGLPDGRIKTGYQALMAQVQTAGSAADFRITAASVTPTPAEGPPKAVTLSGRTTALGFPMTAQLEFTEVAGRLASRGEYRLTEAWGLDHAPWIRLEQAGLRLLVDEAPMPVRGELVGRVGGVKPFDIRMAFPSPLGTTLIAEFAADARPGIRDVYALAGSVNLSNLLPPVPELVGSFGVDRVTLGYEASIPRLSAVGVAVSTAASAPPWTVAGIEITDVRVVIQVLDPANGKARRVNGELSAGVLLSDAADGPRLDLTARLPGLEIAGRLAGELSIGDLIAKLGLGVEVPLTSNLSNLDLRLDVARNAYSLSTAIDGTWSLIEGIVICNLQLAAGVGARSYAYLSGDLIIGDADEQATLSLAARYADGSWSFAGDQAHGSISLTRLAKLFLPDTQQLPAAAPGSGPLDIELDRLHAEIDAGAQTYRFAARVRWQPLAALPELEAMVEVAKLADSAGAPRYVGQLSATGRLFGADVGFRLPFGDSTKVEVQLWDIWAVYEEGVIRFRLSGMSLGQLLTELTSWVTRNRRPVALPSPWNLLNSVALDDFTLQFDTNDKRFTVTYKVPGRGINLGFYVLQGFEVSSGGENTGLRFELVGHGLVDAEPWDATQPDQAPKVPGISDLFELRLLVLGQHVAVPGQDQFDSVPEAIAGFKRLGPPRENEVPVSVDGTGRYPQFDSASNWLVAADFGLLAIGGAERRALVERLGASAPRHLIEAAFVFIDPALYGFRIAIASEARLLAGLEFEILYKKLSDNLGVYQIELDLPDAVRSLDVGALAVTMPQIAIEIFTNGDFLVDLGYPHERDFSRSFMLQGLVPPGLPMLGSGGFYFGALSGGSCDRLPVTRRGTFSPVTAFGIGLMVGFGRSIDKGPLKAGFSLTIVAFIEGVIARFNPTEDARPAPFGATLDDDHYYWLRGTFGLQGQLYGTVDFKLVKARLDAGFSALVSATYESFQPTVLDLVAGVSVAASIRIHLGFFSLKISYSFTIRISERIVLGARAPAPWDDPALAVPAAVPLAFEPLWTPLPAPEPVPLTLYFAPALTIVGDAAETLADQQAAYAAMLFIDAGSDTSASSFELFCRELLRFLAASVVAGTGGRPERDGIDAQLVTLAELERLYGRLTDSQTPSPLPYSAIAEFMSTHFRIEVHAPASADAPEERQAAAFPMLPALRFVLAADGGTLANVDFAGYNPVEGAYLDQIQAQFDALQLAVERQLDPRRAKLPRVRADADQPPAPSMATVVMEDYVGLCARHVVQAALDAMRDYRYSLQPGDTLGAIVAWANAAGNAVSAARILEANAGLPLAPGKTWTLPQVDPDAPQQPGLRYSATQEDSLELIAGRFAAGQDAAFLQQLVALNLTSTGLLVPGVTIALGGHSHVVAGGDSWQSLAAALEKAPADLLADTGIVQSTALIQRLGVWDIPSITCVSDDENFRTAAAIAEHYGLPVGALALAGANLEIADPFAPAAEDEAPTLSLPDLTHLSVGSLFAEMQHCQSLEHLAGMTSRFLLHGLRLPGPAGSEAPGEDVPLYALTGQQHVLPENLTGLTVTLEKDASDAWIELHNAADPTRLVVPADATEQQRIDAVRAYARRHGVVPDVRYLGPAPVFRDDPATFPLRDNIPWQNGGRIALPQQSAEAPDVLDLRIWLLPPGLRKLLEAGRNTLPPALVLEIGAQNATTGSLESRSSSAFAWSTLLDFDVQRFTNAEQPPTTSQLMGATADSTRLLQELLMSLGDDPARIHGVTLLYRASATAKRSEGLQSDGDKDIVFFLNRVNLSTQTNPGPAYGRTAAPIPAAWNGPLGFLRLLWNGSITRSGGYYLFYQNQSTREGLPDRIFDEHGRARLSVLVTWQPAGDEASDQLPPYLNTVVTGDSIEVDRASVFARVTPQRIEHPLAADDTLATLARYYCSKIGTLCAANSSRALNQDADISIDEFWYEVRPDKREPGGMLANIAAYFRVDPARIKDLNPDLGDAEPVAPYRLLRIPSTVLSLADTTFKTLADIRDRYAVGYDALGFANRDTAALFADTTLVVDAGLTLRTPTAQMGAAGMVLERAAPAQTPQSPQDAAYAGRYLLNLYDLLGYRVADTLAFDKSPAGLPMGPTVDVPDGALVSKRQSLPLAGAASAAWQYHETLPAARFARSSPVMAPPGVLEPEPPYAGVGEAVQLELAWQDAFGNRALSPFQNPDLDAGHPLNFPPLPLGFTDRIVGFTAWPSVALAYRLTGGPALVVRLDFDPSRYLPTALSSRPSRVLANTPQWQENAQKDLLIYERIHAQLQHRDRSGVPSLSIGLTTTLRKAINASQPLDDATLAELRDWVAAIYTYLHVRACGEDAPAPTAGVDMRQALRTEELNASAVFSVTVALECEREIALVHPAFKDAPEVCRVITPVSAATRNAAGQQSLVDFAAAFEAAFAEAEVQLKVAASPRGEGGRTAMYAVRFGADGATSIGLRTEGAPLFTAVRPLCTELISRAKVPVHAYETGKGIDWDGTTVPVNASAVDLDAWARDFLADFDRILAPEISTPMFIVDRVVGCDFRDRLLAAKERLADAIALQVVPVLKHQSIAQEVLAAARETLRQQLLIRLGEAYEVDGIAQYPFAVSTPFADVADVPAPRLRGAIVVKEGAVADSDQLSLIPGPLSLAPTTGTGRNYLNVLLRTQNDTEVERLTLDLDWQVSHLELDIRREASLGEYEGSTWLSFLLPAGRRSQAALPAPLRVSLGEAAQMPVPLRAFPKPPSMRLQRFDAVPATGIADIGRWNYEFGYAVKHNRHDVIDAEVFFNVNLGDAAASDAGGRYLPDDLLQYRKVRGAVMEDLQAALKRVDGTSDTEAAAVKAALAPLAALTSLVEHVVEAWDLWVNRTAFRVAPDFTASDSMAFRIQEDPDDSRGGALQVRIVAPNDMPGMPVVSVPGWVTESDPQRPGVYRYRASGDKPEYLGFEAALAIAERNVVVPNLAVVLRQNAWASVVVVRNDKLIENAYSRPEFVYRTQPAFFANPLNPILRFDAAIDIAALGDHPGPRQLNVHLRALLDAVFDARAGATLRLQMTVECRYQVNASTPELSQPVVFVPTYVLARTGLQNTEALAEDLAEALGGWRYLHPVQVPDGRFNFALQLISQDAGAPLPILTLPEVFLRLADILPGSG